MEWQHSGNYLFVMKKTGLFIVMSVCWFTTGRCQVTGDFRSVVSGSWTAASTWQRYSSGGVWESSGVGENSPGQIPGITVSATIQNTHTVTVPYTGTRQCKNLVVNAGGKIFSNNSNTSGNPSYLDVYGNITCNGITGNGNTYDALCFNIEGSSCVISGTGNVTVSRIRKSTATNAITNLTISMDVTCRYNGTAIYCCAPAACVFNVTISSRCSVVCSGDGSGNSGGNFSIDGTAGADAAGLGGTLQVDGTLTLSGIGLATPTLYLTTNNVSKPVNCIINGTINTGLINASASGTAKHTLTINSGGTLNITSEPVSFVAASTTNNVYNLNTGSTVQYSKAGNQTIYVFGSSAYHNLNISGSGSKTLSGSITVNGVLNLSSGRLITGSNNLSLGNLASAIIGPAAVLSVSGGIVNFNNKPLTIQSTSAGTGSISAVIGVLNGVGNVTMQQWITAQRGYRALSNPFTTMQPLSQLTDNFAITGNGTGLTPGNPSAFLFNPNAGSGSALTAINDASSHCWNYIHPAYMAIRGKGSQGINFDYTSCSDCSSDAPTAFIIDATGTLNDGTHVPDYSLQYTNSANNYNLVGNPYASAINLRNLQSNGGAISANANIGSVFYVYNPAKNSGASTVLRGGYDVYLNDGSADVIIPSMGAFYILAKAAGQTINFNESAKTTASALSVMGSGNAGPDLQLVVENNEGVWDEVQFRFEDVATDKATDRFDAEKWNNQLFDFYSISFEQKNLAVDTRSLSATVIPLGIKTNITDSSFRIKVKRIDGLNDFQVILKDKLLHTEARLQSVQDSLCFKITGDTSTKGDNRFELVFFPKNRMAMAVDDTVSSIKIYPNPFADHLTIQTGTNGHATIIQLLDTEGKTIKKINSSQSVIRMSLKPLPAGIYFLRVLNNDGTTSIQKIIKQ